MSFRLWALGKNGSLRKKQLLEKFIESCELRPLFSTAVTDRMKVSLTKEAGRDLDNNPEALIHVGFA
jgi:hypothetical protein